MKTTIQVQYEKRIIHKTITENGVNIQTEIVKTPIQHKTFEQIINGSNATEGRLSDDYGHASTNMSLEQIRASVENRNVVYLVDFFGSIVRFSPQVKSSAEMQSFQNEVSSYSLD